MCLISSFFSASNTTNSSTRFTNSGRKLARTCKPRMTEGMLLNSQQLGPAMGHEAMQTCLTNTALRRKVTERRHKVSTKTDS